MTTRRALIASAASRDKPSETAKPRLQPIVDDGERCLFVSRLPPPTYLVRTVSGDSISEVEAHSRADSV